MSITPLPLCTNCAMAAPYVSLAAHPSKSSTSLLRSVSENMWLLASADWEKVVHKHIAVLLYFNVT